MVETNYYKSKARNLAILLTLLFIGTILTILLLIILHTPIPPYPEGGGGTGNGIELNLGFSDAGMGNNPQELSTTEKEIPKPETQTKDNEELLKQDIEDAPSVNEKIEKKVKKDVKKDITPTAKEIKKEPVKREPVVNAAALYQNAKKNQSADGNKNVAGDQGSPNGNLGAKAFGKSGQGGSGGGTGGGTGTGTGPGSGSGVSFTLSGRNPLGSLPVPEYKQQSEGVVIVAVVVDKEGKVTQADAGQKGTTATDDVLWEAAKQAALKARFDRKPDAPAFQKGTITYRFRLQ